MKGAEKALGQTTRRQAERHRVILPAEDYHQNYYLGTDRVLTRFGYIHQSDAYARYREACGRECPRQGTVG